MMLHAYYDTGHPIVALIEVEGPVNVSVLNLISGDGTILLSINNLTRLGEESYVGVFLPPSEAFVLQLVGTDHNGYNFSHISDTSVEVSFIDLALSMYM